MSGAVVLFRSRWDGRRATLAAVWPPDVLGEEALADPASRTASAEAFVESFALALPKPALSHAMQQHPAVAGAARRWLAERLDKLTEQRADDILLDLPARVAKTLLRLAGRNGRPPLVIEANQRLVAALAGGSRQTVNQVLKHFARRGWVRVEKSRIVVVDQDALRRRSGQPPGLSQSDGVSAPDKILILGWSPVDTRCQVADNPGAVPDTRIDRCRTVTPGCHVAGGSSWASPLNAFYPDLIYETG